MGCSGSFNLHRKSGQNLWLCMEEKRKNSSSSSYTHRVHKGNKLLAPHLTKKESFWCNWRRRWLGLEAIWGIYWAERKQSGNFKMVLFGLVWIRISVCTIYIPVPLNPIVFFVFAPANNPKLIFNDDETFASETQTNKMKIVPFLDLPNGVPIATAFICSLSRIIASRSSRSCYTKTRCRGVTWPAYNLHKKKWAP